MIINVVSGILFISLLAITYFLKKVPHSSEIALLFVGFLVLSQALNGIFKGKVTLRFNTQMTNPAVVKIISVLFVLLSLVIIFIYIDQVILGF
jgi:hypothetical protein